MLTIPSPLSAGFTETLYSGHLSKHHGKSSRVGLSALYYRLSVNPLCRRHTYSLLSLSAWSIAVDVIQTLSEPSGSVALVHASNERKHPSTTCNRSSLHGYISTFSFSLFPPPSPPSANNHQGSLLVLSMATHSIDHVCLDLPDQRITHPPFCALGRASSLDA